MNETYIHPLAIVESEEIGKGTRVWAFSHVMQGASIGQECNIGEHCFVEAGAKVGDRVTIKNGNMLWEGIVIEDGAFIGPSVSFTNDRYPRSPRLEQARARYRQHDWLVSTRVEQGASLGAGSVVVPGVTIGKFAMVGAGSVVTRDIPPHALVIGNPARIRAWVCECGKPLRFEAEQARCQACGRSFTREGDLVQSIGPAVGLAGEYVPAAASSSDGGGRR